MQRASGHSRRAVKVSLAVVVAGAIAAALIFLPLSRWLLSLVDWIRGAGGLGAVVFALAYLTATVLLLPGSLLTAAAGFAYGPIVGTALVSPVSVLAAICSFVLGRSLVRGWVTRKIGSDPRIAAIDSAIGNSGFKIVLLLRLSPITPFNLLNYALGSTRVGLRDYIVASWLGMLPGTALYVYLGSLVTSSSQLINSAVHGGNSLKQWFYWGGLLATLLASILVTRVARRALRIALENAPVRTERLEEKHS